MLLEDTFNQFLKSLLLGVGATVAEIVVAVLLRIWLALRSHGSGNFALVGLAMSEFMFPFQQVNEV